MPKTFSLAEANRSLIFVASVLHEIQEIWIFLMSYQVSEIENKSVIKGKLDRLKNCLQELDQVGCLVKNPDQSTVDFPSFYKDEPIFLCWKLGEEQIDHWHRPEEDFTKRKAVTEDFIKWNSKVPCTVPCA